MEKKHSTLLSVAVDKGKKGYTTYITRVVSKVFTVAVTTIVGYGKPQ